MNCYVYTLLHVLQRFPKHRVVYEFVKGLFLFICCLIPEFFFSSVCRAPSSILARTPTSCVPSWVSFQAWGKTANVCNEQNSFSYPTASIPVWFHSVLAQTHPPSFFDDVTSILSPFPFFRRCQWITIMGFMQHHRIIQIHHKNPSPLCFFPFGKYLLFCGYNSLPCKLPLRQRFTHSPIVKVIRVKISDVIVWIVSAVVFYMRIVGFCIPLAHHWYPTARSFFDEQMHAHFCQQFQLHSCLFQQAITRQARRCVVTIWIHPTLFQEYASEVLKKHPLRSKHPFWDKNHDNPPNVCTQTLSTLFLHVCIVFALCACHSNLPLTLEHSFVLQFCFAKALPPIHVYTLSLCLLLSPSRETKELHCFPWGCGKRLEVGLAQALSANLCCKRCAPFHGIFLASSSDLSQRLYSFSISKAPSSTTIFLAVFYPFVYFIQWLRLVSWRNVFFLVMTFFMCLSKITTPISLTERERMQKWFFHQRFLTNMTVAGFVEINPIFFQHYKEYDYS